MTDLLAHVRMHPGLKWLPVGAVVLLFIYVLLDLNGSLSRGNFLTIATPAQVRSFQVKDASGVVIWRFSSSQSRPLSRVSYGVVPAGFGQEVPRTGTQPRLLKAEEELETETITADRRFTHQGKAWGTSGFRGGYWSSEPLTRQ